MDNPILQKADQAEKMALEYIDNFLGNDLHQEEEIARGIVEMWFEDYRAGIQSSIMPDGRIMFQHKPTPNEDIARFLDPITRAQVEAEKMAQGGSPLVLAWRNRIANLITRRAGE